MMQLFAKYALYAAIAYGLGIIVSSQIKAYRAKKAHKDA